jgi:hypothetical protein
MYILAEDWRFAFSWRDGPVAVVSSARMNPAFLGLPADRAVERDRLRKMVLKDVLMLHFGEFGSDDPRSVLYDDILGADDLDFMTEEIEPHESRGTRSWIAAADRVCERWKAANTALIAKSRSARTPAQILRVFRRSIALHGRYARRFERLRPAPSERRLQRRLLALIRTELAEAARAEKALSRRWSMGVFNRTVRSSFSRNLTMQSLALRLGSASCGALFDPVPRFPGDSEG